MPSRQDAQAGDRRHHVVGRGLGVLGRRRAFLDRLERESAFHDAYLTLLQKHRERALDMGAMHPRELRAYLCKAAIRDCLAELRRAKPCLK